MAKRSITAVGKDKDQEVKIRLLFTDSSGLTKGEFINRVDEISDRLHDFLRSYPFQFKISQIKVK